MTKFEPLGDQLTRETCWIVRPPAKSAPTDHPRKTKKARHPKSPTSHAAASLSLRTLGRAIPPRREDRGHSRTMGGSYDEVDLEDMEWNAELGAFTYQCPCGDLFQITPDELRAGEEIGHCPSCSLVITVVYDDEDLKDLIPEGF